MWKLKSELETENGRAALQYQSCPALPLTAFFSPSPPHVTRRAWRRNADSLRMMCGGGKVMRIRGLDPDGRSFVDHPAVVEVQGV